MTSKINPSFTFFATVLLAPFLAKNEDGSISWVTADELTEINISAIDTIEREVIDFGGEQFACTKITYEDESVVLVTEEISEIKQAYKDVVTALREMISGLDELEEAEEANDDDEFDSEDEENDGESVN